MSPAFDGMPAALPRGCARRTAGVAPADARHAHRGSLLRSGVDFRAQVRWHPAAGFSRRRRGAAAFAQQPGVGETVPRDRRRARRAEHAPRFAIDGEVVAFEGRRTSFERLQGRSGIHDAAAARASHIAVYYYVFDLLHLDGNDTTGLPQTWRKRLLRRASRSRTRLRFTAHRVGAGEKMYEEACRRGDEGVVAKRADAIYAVGPLAELAEVQVRARSGVRRRRIHRTERQPRRARCAARRLLRRRGFRLRRQGRYRLHRARCCISCASGSRS